MTRTPGAGQQRESPPAWRCQITVRQPGRPHSEKSGFESRWVESEAWPSPDLKQFVRKLLHQGGDALSRKGASTHKDLIRLAAPPVRASEGGLKRVNKQPARPRASCWENLPPRLRPCWDDGVRLSALRWEEPRVILTGLPPASTEAAAFWTRVHGLPLTTSHWRSISLTVCQDQGWTASSTQRRQAFPERRKGGRFRDKERKLRNFQASPPGGPFCWIRWSHIGLIGQPAQWFFFLDLQLILLFFRKACCLQPPENLLVLGSCFEGKGVILNEGDLAVTSSRISFLYRRG